MTTPPEDELDGAPEGEVAAGLSMLDALVVSDETFDDEGTGGIAFADAPVEDDSPLDDRVGLALAGGGEPGFDDTPLLGDDTLPLGFGVEALDHADTPAEDPGVEEGLDERVSLPAEPEDLPEG